MCIKKSRPIISLPIIPLRERLYYRDLFRSARYSALEDSEGFSQVCFAIESLGLRLLLRKGTMGLYVGHIQLLANYSIVLSVMTKKFPGLFTRFEALYNNISNARNDAMHTGVYARHATTSAIELCIGLEEALMVEQEEKMELVADFMVKSPITVESWQPVAHARQLMLMHSFSYLPVFVDDMWMLVSEVSMAKFLYRTEHPKIRLAMKIVDAKNEGLDLTTAIVVKPEDNVRDILEGVRSGNGPMLWLVKDEHEGLRGVLSPFELM